MKIHKQSSDASAVNGKTRWSFKKLKPKKGAVKELIGKLSNGIMMPIAVLPIAGLLLGIGAAIQNNLPPNASEAAQAFAAFMKNSGDFVFGNLAVLFAVAIAIAFTRDAGVAALAALIGWICFNGMQSALIIKQANGNFSMLYWTDLPSSVFGSNVGIQSLQTSVFGGAIVGAITATLYNRFYQIKMPKILGFFSGTRFVPIITLVTMMPLAILFAMIWPGIGLGLSKIGQGLGTLSANGGTNALIFGYIERALVPFGLHHAFYAPLWFTSAGGDMTNIGQVAPFIRWTDNNVYSVTGVLLNGQTLPLLTPTWESVVKQLNPGTEFNIDKWVGDQTLWFTLNGSLLGKTLVLSNGEHHTMTFLTFAQNTMNQGIEAVVPIDTATFAEGQAFDSSKFAVAFPGVNPGQYEQGKYPFMIFGLPAAAAAMIMTAPKENRKTAASIIGSSALTVFLTGISEPIEFTFLFLAPWLYWGVHATLCSISFWLMSLLGANVGQTFSGGIIDLTLYGFFPDGLGLHSNSYWAIVIGLFYAPIYYTLFYFLVKRFDLKTPGRGGKLMTKKDYFAAKNAAASGKDNQFTNTQITAYQLIKAFGNEENIELVNACITKLRVSIKDSSKIDEERIKELGAQGIIRHSPTLVHAIFGVDSEPLKTQMNNIIQRSINVEKLAKVANETSDAHIEHDTTSPATGLNEITVYSPMSGTVKTLEDVSDDTFSKKIMGDGIAIEPDKNHEEVINPNDKESNIDVAFPSGHAYVVDVSGAKIMIHIGIDTVTLNQNASGSDKLVAFTPVVKNGDKLDGYKKLVDVDFEFIKNKNIKTITPVIALSDTLKNYDITMIAKPGDHINAKDPIFKLTKKSS